MPQLKRPKTRPLPPHSSPVRREPSEHVWPLMEAFNCLEGEVMAAEVLTEFLELIEAQASERAERLQEQAASMERLRQVASRRK